MNFYNKIILYDDENMKYLTGTFKQCSISNTYEDFMTITGDSRRIKMNTEISGIVNDFEINETIKLDETLMKRIAKYNKEQELKQIEKQIKNKKEELKELEDIIEDRHNRVEKLKKFIANLYDLDLNHNDVDDYYYDDEEY